MPTSTKSPIQHATVIPTHTLTRVPGDHRLPRENVTMPAAPPAAMSPGNNPPPQTITPHSTNSTHAHFGSGSAAEPATGLPFKIRCTPRSARIQLVPSIGANFAVSSEPSGNLQVVPRLNSAGLENAITFCPSKYTS